MKKLTLSILNTREDLAKLENYIELVYKGFQLPDYLQGKITLSIISAVNNSMLFGESGSKTPVKIMTYRNKQKVTINVENTGDGYDLNPDNMESEAKGLYLLMMLTDQLLFTKNGAMVTMTFLLDDGMKAGVAPGAI